MRRAILTLLATSALAGTVQSAAPQYPRPPQGPPCRDEGVALCPCSINGVCPCGPGSQCPARCLASGLYRWKATSNPNQTALYVGTLQQGNYWHAEGEYRKLDESGGNTRWVACDCPVAVPAPTAVMTSPIMTPTYFTPAQTYRPSMTAPAARTRFGRGGSSCGPSGCR